MPGQLAQQPEFTVTAAAGASPEAAAAAAAHATLVGLFPEPKAALDAVYAAREYS